MSYDDRTADAVELAEAILEGVSSIDQDWGTISALARELTALAEAAASAAAPDRETGEG
jgi:hypothetical protein